MHLAYSITYGEPASPSSGTSSVDPSGPYYPNGSFTSEHSMPSAVESWIKAQIKESITFFRDGTLKNQRMWIHWHLSPHSDPTLVADHPTSVSACCDAMSGMKAIAENEYKMAFMLSRKTVSGLRGYPTRPPKSPYFVSVAPEKPNPANVTFISLYVAKVERPT